MRVVFALLLLVLCLQKFSWGKELCDKTSAIVEYKLETYKSACGWWGWRRCNRYRSVKAYKIKTEKVCCKGDFGYPDNGCEGECGYKASTTASACNGRDCRDYTCDKSAFHSPLPISFDKHVDDNDASKVFTANATCFVRFECPDPSCTCKRKKRSVDSHVVKRETGYLCSRNEPCTSCSVSNTHMFEVKNNVEIWRKECLSNCRTCGNQPGCFDNDVIYSTQVTCTGSGYDNNDAEISTPININPRDADPPAIAVSSNTVQLLGSEPVGSAVLTVNYEFPPPYFGQHATYTLSGADSPTSGNTLLGLSNIIPPSATALPGNKRANIVVATDLSEEPSATYYVTVCVHTRRHDVCTNFTVNFVTIVTTTTTPPPTTTPVNTSYCQAVGSWRNVTHMNSWCQMVCNHDVQYCPSSHCTCSDEPVPGYRYCEPVGIWRTVNGMDWWCDYACNDPILEYREQSCLDSYCSCIDVPSK